MYWNVRAEREREKADLIDEWDVFVLEQFLHKEKGPTKKERGSVQVRDDSGRKSEYRSTSECSGGGAKRERKRSKCISNAEKGDPEGR